MRDDSGQPATCYRLMGVPVHRRIRTGQLRTPWISVFMLSLVWFTFGFNIFAGGQALTFTIQRYAKNPQDIALITTIGSLLIVGPFISYLSDQVWTRFGRRRPFVILGWAGGALGLLCFAGIDQLLSGFGQALVAAHLPAISVVVLLALVVLGYQKLYELAAPMEALFMETVAPQQRGRFFAIRGVLFMLAVMLFYQVLWPNFDLPVDLFAWLGRPGALVLKGEQVIYLFGGTMFLITGAFLILCIEEVKSPNAPNHRLRDMFLGSTRIEHKPGEPSRGVETTLLRAVRASLLVRVLTFPFAWFFGRTPIGRFFANFLRDVFLRKENLPFYLIMVIPGIEAAVWGGFLPLMQNDQFGYTKANQALWALPGGIITMVAITPFAGWYSDVRLTVRWWLRIVLLVFAGGCLGTVLWLYRHYAPTDIRELPAMWVMTTIALLLAAGSVATVVVIVETVLDRVGREHARAWIALLTVFKSMVIVVSLYLWIRSSPDHVPSITSWMIFMVINGSLSALIDTFLAPMLYDYIPRSKMGTVAAGSIFYGTVVRFLATNLGAWWVVFYSSHFSHPAHSDFDYTSIYLLQILTFVPVLAVKVYFLRLIVTGRMPKAGVLEVEQEHAGAPTLGHR